MTPRERLRMDQGDQDSAKPAGSWLSRIARELFYVDLRSLAALRIAMGVVIIADLVLRGRHLVAHYTDQGVAPREVLVAEYGWTCYLSLHYWCSGSPAAVTLLFLLSGLAAGALIVGYRTRLATVLCWYLLASLIMRLPFLHNAGDRILQLLLFWSLFLPVGVRWSLDTRRHPGRGRCADTYVSVAGFALLLQICFIYWFSVAMKMNSPEWVGGETVGIALDIDVFATPAGVWLRQFTAALPLLTYVVLNFELLGPFVPFIPGFTTPGRLLAVVAFVLMHLSFGLFFHLGMFSVIGCVAWLAFLPGWFWDRVQNRGDREPSDASALRPGRPLNTVAAALFVFVVILNFRSVPQLRGLVPFPAERAGKVLRLTQVWGMFTDFSLNGWFVVPGHLADGQEVNLLTGGGPVPWEKPGFIKDVYPSGRWLVFLHGYRRLDQSPFWPSLAGYLCRDWNRRHEGGERLERLSIGFMRRGPLPTDETARHYVFLEHTCPQCP